MNQNLFRIVIAGLCLIGPRAVFAHTAYNVPACETLLQLGYQPDFEIKPMPLLNKKIIGERFMISARHPQFKMELAFLDITLVDGGQTAMIEKIDVLNDNNFGKGLSKTLVAVMLENYPQINKLEIELGDVNQRIVTRGLQESKSCTEAFQQTPMYKVGTRFGFQISSEDCSPTTGEYKFVMTLEPAH